MRTTTNTSALLLLVAAMGSLTPWPDAGARAAGPQDVVVLRGTPSPIPTPAPEHAPARLTGIAAGKTLWLLDQERHALVGCRLVNTVNVGERAIECGARWLPRDGGD